MAQPTCSLVALRQLSVTKPVLVGALLCSLVIFSALGIMARVWGLLRSAVHLQRRVLAQ